jgi:hypothetical protein
MIGGALVIVFVLVLGIWIMVEFGRMKHKLLAIFLILLIFFFYFSFSMIFKNKDIDYKNPSGLTEIGKVYLSWFSSILGNFKSLTGHAVKMNWRINATSNDTIE